MAGTITAIEPQARHADRYNLYIDHRFVLGLTAAVAARLRVGQAVTQAEVAALEDAEALETAYDKALYFLEPRPRSAAEIRRHLLKKEIAPEIIDQVLARLSEAGLADDRAFAKYWVENREEFRPRAGRALRFELKRKGLADEDIRAVTDDLDESESAYRAGAARALRWRDLDHREFREKLCAFLMRRGFDYQTARHAADRWWDETRAEPLS